jgi:hypothetical protein
LYPKNEAEFIQLIEDIDNELKKKNILIHQRPIHAIREVCLRLEISLNVVPDGPPIPGFYSGDSLGRHFSSWYQKRCGDRLKVSFGPGSVAVLICRYVRPPLCSLENNIRRPGGSDISANLLHRLGDLGAYA